MHDYGIFFVILHGFYIIGIKKEIKYESYKTIKVAFRRQVNKGHETHPTIRGEGEINVT